MTRALICTGVLGGGTAAVFALALAASMLFPQGSLVPMGWSGGWGKPMPMIGDGFGGGGAWTNDVFVTEVAPRTEVAPLLVDPVVPVPAPVEADS